MTAATIDREAPPATTRRRAIAPVVKLMFVNTRATIATPLLVLLFIFAVNLAIWAILAASLSGKDKVDAQGGLQYSGASLYVFVYMMITAILALNLTFPFALGYGVTRRNFYLGASLSFAMLAVGYGVLLTVLGYLEQATHGWGFGGRMFTAVYYSDGPWYERLFVFTVGLLFFFAVGLAYGTAYARWRATGVLVFSGLLVVVALGAVAILTATASWPSFGASIASAGPTGVAEWLLVPTAMFSIAGLIVIRRATPKNLG
ncbi:MAG: hypothetical protein JWO10_1164, partial [Microbacteriaceae bacterium]|nr:hypothetical protein [Microbacteriaceae bacterium]